ncbi:substrate-binding periplasmic protein [Fluviispira vulneris]|uniref:substrate-binding periplasmic protein n=1 Tax=Fluviispira vulneris TaxID=2763012 RepID=UPI0016463511|nr:transporter substrate-binding domain-containing protein [Fluviispira vulneris]
MKKIFLQFLLVLFLISLNCFSYSSEKLTLITGNDFAPYTDEKLKNGGMYTTIVKEIFKRLKVNYGIEFLPWARGYEMVKRNKADVTFPYAVTEERKKEVKYSSVSLVNGNIFIYANVKHQSKKNFANFKNTILCNPLGYYKEDALIKLIEKKEIKEISKFDAKSCLLAIIKNEADFMTSNDAYMNSSTVKKLNYMNKVIPIGERINELKLYVIFKKEMDNKFINQFDEEAKKFIQTKEYKEIIDSY